MSSSSSNPTTTTNKTTMPASAAERMRPCCSIPGGRWSLLAALCGTAALGAGWTTQSSCRYIHTTLDYCPPPPPPEPQFACCGDCHCITGVGNSCPEQVPMMNISKDTLQQLKSLTLLNPMNLTCNPYDTQYTGIPCETTPPQIYTELGDGAVCGVVYETDSTITTPDQGLCPTRYRLETFPTLQALQEIPNAVLTHWGSCGVCSTTQDLAVYIENTDLTTLVGLCVSTI
jgi:hypothetical protein